MIKSQFGKKNSINLFFWWPLKYKNRKCTNLSMVHKTKSEHAINLRLHTGVKCEPVNIIVSKLAVYILFIYRRLDQKLHVS